MTNERFDELVNTSLSHPLVPFRFTRILLGLRAAIEAHPDAERAFEVYCAARTRLDNPDEGREGTARSYEDIHELVQATEERSGQSVGLIAPACPYAGTVDMGPENRFAPCGTSGRLCPPCTADDPGKEAGQVPPATRTSGVGGWWRWIVVLMLFAFSVWQSYVIHAMHVNYAKRIREAEGVLHKPIGTSCVKVQYSLNGSDWREQTAGDNNFPIRRLRLMNTCSGFAVAIDDNPHDLGSVPSAPEAR